MKSILVVLFLVGLTAAQMEENFITRSKRAATDSSTTCETNAEKCCSDNNQCEFDCSSLILESDTHYNDFKKFTNDHLIRSFEYLFLSAQFGTHMKDRPGFEKVLHGLADGAWNKGLEMIKESSKRGVAHSFTRANIADVKAHGDMNEVQALAKAVEIEKKLLISANDIHRHHSHASSNDANSKPYDAALAHYLQEEIIEEKTETVRTLVGHVNDLKNIFKREPRSFPLSLYLFDQFLQK